MNNQEHTITSGGVRLFVRTKGSGDRVVIVPNAIYMEDAFDSLVEGRTLAFFDLRNRGRSEHVADRAELSRGIEHDVEDIDAVRRYLRAEQVDLIGHSYPAMAVAIYAMRFARYVRRAAMLGPMQPNLAVQYPPHLMHVDAVTQEVFAALGRVQANPVSDPIDQCRNAWAILRRLYVANPADADKLSRWGYCDLENERNMLRHMSEFILPSIKALTLTLDDFAKAQMPMLVIHGRKDRSSPFGAGRDWAMRLPNARLIELADVAHVPWVEAPKTTLAALHEFLDGEWPAASTIVRGGQ